MKWCSVVIVRNGTTLHVSVYLQGLSLSLHTTVVLIVTNNISMERLHYICVWIDYITCMFVYDVAYIGLCYLCVLITWA